MSGSGYISGAEYKLRRAQLHLDTLTSLVAPSLQPDDSWTFFVDAGGNWHFDGNLGPSSMLDLQEWAVVIGDIIHNLACAIEYLACGLIEGNGGKPKKLTQFPMHKTRPASGDLPDIRPGGVLPAARPILDRFQPYEYDTEYRLHPMWLLRTLWEYDKHHLPIVSTPFLGPRWHAYDAGDEPRNVRGVLVPIQRTDDSVTCRFDAEGDVDIAGDVLVQIRLGIGSPGRLLPGSELPLLETLRDIQRRVADALEQLRPYASRP